MQTLEILEIAECPATLCNPLHTKKYVVPIYQRLFVWGEVQIKTLLNDLKAAMETSVPYYIGVITVVEKNNHWEIVDGQQRLTFLTLFGCECVRRGWDLQHDWKSFIYYSDTDSVSGKSQSLRIHYFGRENDASDIKNMLSEANIANVQNSNFRLFHDCFESVMRSFESNEKKKQQFIQYVFQQASFLISTLPSTYSPLDLNLFFEKMNAAGRQLEPVDIVKGKYFAAYASAWNKYMNFDVEFKGDTADKENTGEGSPSILNIISDETIQVSEEPNTVQEVSYNRLVMKPSVFLLHVLELSVGREILREPSRLLEIFGKEALDGKIIVEEFLAKMKEYRTWLDDNIIFLKRDADGSYEYLFRKEIRECAEKVINHDYDKYSGEESNDNIMKQFQSMLYVSSSDYQEWVLNMFKKCTKKQKKLALDTLKEWDNQKHLDEGSQCWTYWNIDRYWFWRLDYYLWENRKKIFDKESVKVASQYVFRRNRSIEHIAPQNPKRDSKIVVSDKPRDSFGNLVMISSSQNSSLQNESFEVKRAYVDAFRNGSKNGTVESLKMLKVYDGAGNTGWSDDAIKSHGDEMIRILIDSFPQEDQFQKVRQALFNQMSETGRADLKKDVGEKYSDLELAGAMTIV